MAEKMTIIEELDLQKGQKTIIIRNNEEINLPLQLFSMRETEHLYIIGTPIKILNSEILLLENLKSLYLFDTQITCLPDEVFELTNLKILDFSGSPVDELSDKVGNLKNLVNLNVAKSNLKSIPVNALVYLKLKRLYIFGTQIQLTDTDLQHLGHIKHIFLNLNQTNAAEIKNNSNLVFFDEFLKG